MSMSQSNTLKYKNGGEILLVLSIAFIAIFSIAIFFVGPELIKARLQQWSITEPGQIGDVFGGTLGPLIAWLAAILTFAAFWVQYQANLEQRNQFNQTVKENNLNLKKGQIELRFFELLKMHIDNRNIVIEKYKSFRVLIDDLHAIIFSIEGSTSELSKIQVHNIGYEIFFHGAYKENLTGYGNSSFQQVYRIFRRHMKLIKSETVSGFFKTFQQRLDNSKKSIEYFTGTEDVLGHYYRHLYQTVKYINEQHSSVLSYQEKYFYVKTLNAQFSISEQLLFFYNALSDLGRMWELDETLGFNQRLITKYNLIKNIPIDILTYPKVKDHFPLVVFESEPIKSAERISLENKY